jgi:xanthine dehydrogenase accessory factor
VVPRTAPPEEVLRAALTRLEQGHRAVVATVLRRRGSTPSTPGQKLALLSPEKAVGTIGGGAIEHRVLAQMARALVATEVAPAVHKYELGASMGMCCGGSVEVLIEVLDPAISALIIGAGHIGTAVAPVLAALGFRVTVCDGRDDAVGSHSLPNTPGLSLLSCDHDDPEVLAAVGRDRGRAAALVMTHDHFLDQSAIEWALRQGFAFVGGVGSRAKAARTRTRLEVKGFAAEEIERVEMPLGVDIRARLPAEIAVSIAGGLIRWRATLLGNDRKLRRQVSAEPTEEQTAALAATPVLALADPDGAAAEE